LLLTAETQAILTRIRTYGWTLLVFGMSPGEAWRLVKARVERRIQGAGVAVQDVNVYRRYVHELVKAFRTETGEPLPRGSLHQHKVAWPWRRRDGCCVPVSRFFRVEPSSGLTENPHLTIFVKICS
jgi:hypothetical protein